MRKSGNLLRKQCQKAPRSRGVLFRVLFHCCFRCERKYLKDNKDNKLLLASEICTNSCPWTLSVPRSSQLPESELFASLNRQYPQTTVCAYFLAQSSLLFIYDPGLKRNPSVGDRWCLELHNRALERVNSDKWHSLEMVGRELHNGNNWCAARNFQRRNFSPKFWQQNHPVREEMFFVSTWRSFVYVVCPWASNQWSLHSNRSHVNSYKIEGWKSSAEQPQSA